MPSEPLTPAVSDVTNSSAVLTWSAPVPNGASVDGYALQYRATSAAEWTVVDSADIGRKLATVNEATQGTRPRTARLSSR